MMTSTVSKRNFLQALGAAAGVGAVYRGMEALGLGRTGTAAAAPPDLPPGSGAGKSVAILGAGIAGMTAAYELARAGYRCTILEASGRAGGRNLTVRAGDRVAEDGQPPARDLRRGRASLCQSRRGAHPPPPRDHSLLLQEIRRGARSLHQRQPRRALSRSRNSSTGGR